MALRAFADAAQVQRLQLNRRKLRIGMIAQRRKQRERGAVDGLVVGVERSEAFRLTRPHSGWLFPNRSIEDTGVTY